MNKESMQPLSLSDISPQLQDQVSVQDYSPKPKIDGVRIVDLRHFSDDGGSFAELIRLTDEGTLEAIPEFQVRQTSYSQVLPGAIKAFHLHFNQEDLWFVPPTDRLLVGLVDARQGSVSEGVEMRFVLGAGKAQLLYIPRGVAHGGANLWDKPAQIIYFLNQQFSLEQPDERRLPWDMVGADFWKITEG
jgi:dTDP-4-dehydrorhamnose 3,5-epimerase